jgi:hypothetical protein
VRVLERVGYRVEVEVGIRVVCHRTFVRSNDRTVGQALTEELRAGSEESTVRSEELRVRSEVPAVGSLKDSVAREELTAFSSGQTVASSLPTRLA